MNLNSRKLILFLALALLAVYALFQARFVILGPEIKVSFPAENQALDSPLLVLRGTAQNAAYLSLDDRQIYTDGSGNWSEKLLLGPGLNIIKLDAKDRFGRTYEKLVRVVLN